MAIRRTIGAVIINNMEPDLDTGKYPFITVRVVQGELWYYGADETLERAQQTIEGCENGFIIKVEDHEAGSILI